MPDISMCNGQQCPKKDTCFRYLAEPSKWRQTYFLGIPLKEDGTCEHYWERINDAFVTYGEVPQGMIEDLKDICEELTDEELLKLDENE